MKSKEAKDIGFTHDAELYGVPIWFNEYTSDVEPKNKLLGYWLDFLIWIESNIGVNDLGFPIKINVKL